MVSEETPYEVARRMHELGASEEEVVRTLRGMGLDEDDVRIANRAGRGQAGVASSVALDEPAPVPSLAEQPPAEAPQHPCPTHAQWPVAATCPRCGKFFCHQCLRDAGLTEFPESKQCPDCEKSHPVEKKLTGIAGWLIIPSVQISLAPLGYFVWALVGVYTAINKPPQAAEGVFQAIVSTLLCVYSGYTAVQFFWKTRRTVPLMIGFYVASMFVTLLAAGLDEKASATRGLGSTVIWIVYFLQSKRVKNTFTR